MIAVIIPANNEERLMGRCLSALLASNDPGRPVEIIVAANGCTDGTVAAAEAQRSEAEARGWALKVLDLPEGGKIGALNAADSVTNSQIRVYVDADVIVTSPLLGQLAKALDGDTPRYGSGTLNITGGPGLASRGYARTWAKVPFMAQGVPGCGLFAMNAAGRARWVEWPQVISDDTFARLQFTPDERISVPAPYDWPIADGFKNLLKVRRRQDAGVMEIEEKFPELLENDDKARLGLSGLARLALSAPLSFAVYAAVALGVRLSPRQTGWSRGR